MSTNQDRIVSYVARALEAEGLETSEHWDYANVGRTFVHHKEGLDPIAYVSWGFQPNNVSASAHRGGAKVDTPLHRVSMARDSIGLQEKMNEMVESILDFVYQESWWRGVKNIFWKEAGAPDAAGFNPLCQKLTSEEYMAHLEDDWSVVDAEADGDDVYVLVEHVAS